MTTEEKIKESVGKRMKKIFVSMPMNGRTEEAIKKAFVRTKKVVEVILEEEVELIDTWLEGEEYNGKPVMCIGESIKRMQDADLFVTFIGLPYYMTARGCEIEAHVARSYGIGFIEIPINVAISVDELKQMESEHEKKCKMTGSVIA